MHVDRRALLLMAGMVTAAKQVAGSASSLAHAKSRRTTTSMRPAAITFDVYGTLVEWDQSLAAVIKEILEGYGLRDAGIQTATNACNAEALRLEAIGPFRSYRLILREALKPAMATAGVTPTSADADLLIQRLSRVPPFPEVPGVIAELAQSFRLAPITNSDDDFIAGTLKGIGPVFATTVTAEQAKAYKPNPGLFRYALRKLGMEPGSSCTSPSAPFPTLRCVPRSASASSGSIAVNKVFNRDFIPSRSLMTSHRFQGLDNSCDSYRTCSNKF